MSFQFGEIVLIRFPHTDGVSFSKRPALVLLDTVDQDVILCRITSVAHSTQFDVSILNWAEVGLLNMSTIRVHKIATIQKNLIEKKIGIIDENLKKQVKQIVVSFVA